jgi:hypothetical protein
MRLSFWRKCRVCFRWFRISAWIFLLAALCAVVWLNRVGLPDFLKTRLVATLHQRGIELEFTRMRLHLENGIVAENVRIGGSQSSGSPSLSLEQMQLQLDYHALLHRQLQVSGLVLRRGKFVWPVSPTNTLRLDNIQADVRFQTNDTWTLDNLQADFAGAKLTLSGDIRHAPEMSTWEMFRGAKSTNQPDLREQLRKFSDSLHQIHFAGKPELSLSVDGDGRDLHSFVIRLKAGADAAQTPWFSAREIQLAANLTIPADAPTNFDAAWGFWTNAQPYILAWTANATHLQSEKLDMDSAAVSGFWRAPELAVRNMSAELGGGKFKAGAKLNVATRELFFTNAAAFDPPAIAKLLPEKVQALLAEISWMQPPSLQGKGSLILPAWTNRAPDWPGEVQPTIFLDGELGFMNAAVHGLTLDSVHSHFSYSNLVWQLPDFALSQSKTKLELSGNEDEATKKFHLHLRGAIYPESARPFLTASNVTHAFDLVKLAEPLVLDVEASGRLHNFESVVADGRVALTNFTIRSETFGDVAVAMNYTNHVLELLNPLTRTGEQMMTADSVTFDFNQQLILFTNGLSSADPGTITRAIGPKTARTVAPYQFLAPPTARVNGQLPLRGINSPRDMTNVDMTFDIIKGAPFQWEKFQTTNVLGIIHWQGQLLTLTNVTAAVYGGDGNGFAVFDFRPAHEGADYAFAVAVTNVDLHLLALGLISPTNHLEGALSGKITVTHADTRDWRTWDGYGRARLRDGLIWDEPIFGILSPVLNTFSPGLGSSRATDAAAGFIVSNGVIYTDSLEIRSTMAQLQYAGTMDLSGNVNALVTAKLLHNTPVLGSVISIVLWPVSKVFEYQITGTLKDPKREPAFLGTKFLMMPLHPIRSVQEMFPGGAVTNAPPGN